MERDNVATRPTWDESCEGTLSIVGENEQGLLMRRKDQAGGIEL